MRLTATMTVLRVANEDLLLHSPLPLTPERRAAVSALGRLAHLYAPNTFHHQWLGDWSRAYPTARVHGPSGLVGKRPDLRIDRFHDRERAAEFGGLLEEVHIDGFRLEETVLVHCASRTAVVADLVHNIGRPSQPWTKLYAGAMGFYDRVALSRAIRWTAFHDRGRARRSVDELLAHDFDRLVVGHGAPIVADARDALVAATRWLPNAALRPAAEAKPPRRLWVKPCG
jgi:uncharacterized protein (UPF0548 family)